MKFDPNWHPEGVTCEAALRERLPQQGPVDWMIVGGSGIGKPLVAEGEHSLGLTIRERIPLASLGLPAPSVAGHGSELVFGELARDDSGGGGDPIQVCIQTGRIHPYEGHSAALASAPLGAVLSIGARQVLLTSAVGGIDPALRVGQVVSYRDHFNMFGPTSLRGPAFIDCSNLYDRELRARLQSLVDSSDPGAALPEVVYGHARGPQYESPTEVAALRTLGATVVGMSTTYEAILAAAHGVPTCGLGVVTNAAGAEDLNHIEVQEESGKARGRLANLIRGLLGVAPR